MSQKIRSFARDFERKIRKQSSVDVLSTIWAVNGITSDYVERASRFFGAKLEDFVDVRFGSSMWRDFHLETLANEALIHSRTPVRPVLKSTVLRRGQFQELSHALWRLTELEDVHDLKDENVKHLPARMVWLQNACNHGVVSAQYHHRFWYIYNTPKIDAVFTEIVGLSIERFCGIGFTLAAKSRENPWFQIDEIPELGISSNDMKLFLRRVSHPLVQLSALAIVQRKPYEEYAGERQFVPRGYRTSVFRQYPIVSLETGQGLSYCVPFPALLMRRFCEGIIHDFPQEQRGGVVGNQLGDRFEHLVLNLMKHGLKEHFNVQGEYPTSKGKKSPDVIVSDGGGKLKMVCECKARRLELLVRKSHDPWSVGKERGLEKLREGVLQIWRFCQRVRDGKDANLKEDLHSVFGLVATMHPWMQADFDKEERLMEEANRMADSEGVSREARVPVGFISVEEMETIVSLPDPLEVMLGLRWRANFTSVADLARPAWREKIAQARSPGNQPFQYPFNDRLNSVMPWFDVEEPDFS